MGVDRVERLNVLLRREIAEALYKVFASGAAPVNLAALSVTRVECASNLRNANVYVAILGHEDERGKWLRALADEASALQAIINKNMNLKYTPRLHFHLDIGLEKGDHVLDVLYHMEENGELPPE